MLLMPCSFDIFLMALENSETFQRFYNELFVQNRPMVCTDCGKRFPRINSYSYRTFVTPSNFGHKILKILIIQIYCPACHRTHYVLPVFCVPYSHEMIPDLFDIVKKEEQLRLAVNTQTTLTSEISANIHLLTCEIQSKTMELNDLDRQIAATVSELDSAVDDVVADMEMSAVVSSDCHPLDLRKQSVQVEFEVIGKNALSLRTDLLPGVTRPELLSALFIGRLDGIFNSSSLDKKQSKKAVLQEKLKQVQWRREQTESDLESFRENLTKAISARDTISQDLMDKKGQLKSGKFKGLEWLSPQRVKRYLKLYHQRYEEFLKTRHLAAPPQLKEVEKVVQECLIWFKRQFLQIICPGKIQNLILIR